MNKKIRNLILATLTFGAAATIPEVSAEPQRTAPTSGISQTVDKVDKDATTAIQNLEEIFNGPFDALRGSKKTKPTKVSQQDQQAKEAKQNAKQNTK